MFITMFSFLLMLRTGSGAIDQAVGEAMVSDPFVASKLTVKFGNQSFASEPNYWVLSTDYTQYSMVFSCQQFTEALHFEIAWILSRTPTISAELKEELLSKYESVGVSRKPFHFTPQGEANNCTYHYPTPESEDKYEGSALPWLK